jgi:predicted protein tyrosine phosphatase
MRILTVCEQGLNRSVTAKYLLQDNHEVLAAGLNLSPDTLRLLYDWADQIVLLDARFLNRIPTQTKVLVCNVGPDHYEHHYNPELVHLLRGLLKTAGLLDSSPRVSISNSRSSR